MNPSNLPPLKPVATDQDLAEQARPGHGIPSQDPDIAAQVSLEPWEAEREANSVLAGGGMMVGAAGNMVRPEDATAADTAPEKKLLVEPAAKPPRSSR